jgi:hypothetical protein
MENSPLLHDDYQFTNLLLLTTLVLELIKEQVTIEILVIVTIVIIMREMSIHVWFVLFFKPYIYTFQNMIQENLRLINIPDLPKII